MNTVIHRLFAGLLHVYPRDHREMFGAEMEGVFGEVLADARCEGRARLTCVATRELMAIMGCGLLARFSAAQEDLMNTRSTGRASWLGALAFGLAFALARWPIYAHWDGGLLISIAAGALGGWLISLIGAGGRRRLALACAGALAFGLDYVLRLATYSLAQQGVAGTYAPLVVLAIVAEFVIVGAVFGVLAGFVDGQARLSARLAAVGAVGALLGSAIGLSLGLGIWGTAQAVESWRQSIGDGSGVPLIEVGRAITWLVPVAVGLIMGRWFGRAEAAVRADRVIGKATA